MCLLPGPRGIEYNAEDERLDEWGDEPVPLILCVLVDTIGDKPKQ